MGIIILIPMFLALYFLMLRPQQKKQRELQALMASLKAGDEVVLSSGIYGIVGEIDGDIIWLEVAQDLELKVRRSAVEGLVGPREEDPTTAPLVQDTRKKDGKDAAKDSEE